MLMLIHNGGPSIDKNICNVLFYPLHRCFFMQLYFLYSGQMVRLWSRAEETPPSDEMMRIHPDVLNTFPLNEVMA